MSLPAKSERPQLLTLSITGDDGFERSRDLTSGILRIGRGSDNDVVLPGADKGVSRAHAELRHESGGWIIVDLQSQNGTWVDGQRVQRADVVPDQEIEIGHYRLRLVRSVAERRSAAAREGLSERPASPLPFRSPQPVNPVRTAEVRELRATGTRRGSRLALFGGVVAVVGAAFAIGRFLAPSSAPATTGAESSTAAASGNSRTAAFEARYAASKDALERRDFVAAIAGFDALLREAPGFMDTPQLLVEAREGARSAARAAAAEGRALDAADDWLGALRKYGEAHTFDPATPGLDDAVAQVWEKMRVAGHDAFARAEEFEAGNRSAEALDGYERAAQWLPVDDPMRAVARTRADRLRTRLQ